MNIAQGSLEEVRYYFLLARDLEYVKDIERERLDEVARLLTSYIRAVLGSQS
jgi:four helix bundle protein